MQPATGDADEAGCTRTAHHVIMEFGLIEYVVASGRREAGWTALRIQQDSSGCLLTGRTKEMAAGRRRPGREWSCPGSPFFVFEAHCVLFYRNFLSFFHFVVFWYKQDSNCPNYG